MRSLLLISFLPFLLNSSIYAMSNFVSNSVTPSIPESLTFEQEQKIEEEFGDLENQNLVQSHEEFKLENEWCCDKKFNLDILKRKYKGFCCNLCDLDSNLAVFIGPYLKIFDINSGKYLREINLLKGERSSFLGISWLHVNNFCKLPGNRISYLISESFYNSKKIKIVDLNSNKILKNFINCELLGEPYIRKCSYLPNDRLVLLCSKEHRDLYPDYLMIVDLKSGKLLNKIDIKDTFGRSIFEDNPEKDSFARISSVHAFSDGKLFVLSTVGGSSIVDPITGEIEWRSRDFFKPQDGIFFSNHDFKSTVILPDNTILVLYGLYKKQIISLRNEKYNFDGIKKTLNIIPDLQNIVLEYLSDRWMIDKAITFKSSEDSKIYFLSKDKVLKYRSSSILCKDSKFHILDLNNGKEEEINLEKSYIDIIALQDGKIAVRFKNGSVQIWKEEEGLLKV